MGDLVLRAPGAQLNLAGVLTLTADGGTVKVDDRDILVELPTSADPHGSAPPVLQLPPPGSLIDDGPDVWVVASLNPHVTIDGRPVVTQGVVLQGHAPPTWPGMVLPSQANQTVTVEQLPINVTGDRAAVFASGAVATLTTSGQDT